MSITPSLLNEIRQFHNELRLAGSPERNILNVSDQILSYLVSILRQEEPVSLPQISDEKWSDLLSYLSYHGIVPLLYFKIAQFPTEFRPPEKIVARMRKVFLKSCARYLRMEKQLHEILGVFSKEKIGVLAIKGTALAWTVYLDPATRPSMDLDLLVEPQQYLKAHKILNQIGYRCKFKRFKMLQDFFNAEPFVNQTTSRRLYPVDLHWSLFQYHGTKRDGSVEEFFRRAKTVETPTLTFKTLDNVDALIYAAFHLILHHPEALRLTWISDIAFLARHLKPDEWELLQERTSALKISLAMEKALKLAQMWNGLEIPEKYRDLTKWPKAVPAEKDEFTYVTNKHRPDIRMKDYIRSLRATPQKTQFLLNFFFPDSQYIRMTYPSSKEWLLPWSYVRRWWHWFRKLVQYFFYKLSSK